MRYFSPAARACSIGRVWLRMSVDDLSGLRLPEQSLSVRDCFVC